MACNHKDIAEYIIENYDVKFKILDNSEILIYDDISELKIEYSDNWVDFHFKSKTPIDLNYRDSIMFSTTEASGGFGNKNFTYAIESIEKIINFNARMQSEKLN